MVMWMMMMQTKWWSVTVQRRIPYKSSQSQVCGMKPNTFMIDSYMYIVHVHYVGNTNSTESYEYQPDGCIVWNAHNKVLGENRF